MEVKPIVVEGYTLQETVDGRLRPPWFDQRVWVLLQHADAGMPMHELRVATKLLKAQITKLLRVGRAALAMRSGGAPRLAKAIPRYGIDRKAWFFWPRRIEMMRVNIAREKSLFIMSLKAGWSYRNAMRTSGFTAAEARVVFEEAARSGELDEATIAYLRRKRSGRASALLNGVGLVVAPRRPDAGASAH